MRLPASGRHYLSEGVRMLALEIWAAQLFGWMRQAVPRVVVPAAGRQLQVPAEGS
ncbi:hypothetical protein [Stenotrophomonas maltophilia]|uniref:hypothetical protein n=1 Tax=Stenotrophomonas maltophilia TaxID=40324 RepID=UPI0002B8BDA9|nr:hypothetical protein [Stenotrophomonas maltophilia]EMF62393.1 Hypothetical protein EPM1_0067 [Stenotrophomonas maltophilia EPM1]SSM90096.1 Uncharacterised protein [Acinetobacter baumannii]EKT4099200.1 hypothetical protein [Stenotrophomonas maltophilia]MBH1598699.1 hypothetical protein [Stenotrophomonas maltophilia]MBH1610841.1 hypothetical protein [Stenotrophomonas maltophilia]